MNGSSITTGSSAFSSGRLRSRSAAAAIALAGLVAALFGPAAPANADWEPATTIDNSGSAFSSSGSGAVAVGSNGLTTALFLQRSSTTPSGKPGDPFVVRRPAGDVPWSTPLAVSTPAGAANSLNPPRLAASGDGGTLGAFQFDPAAGGSNISVTRWPTPAATPGTATQVLCTAGPSPECAANTPQVALDSAGNGYAVGATQRGFNGDVLFARTDPTTGAWQPATIVAPGFNPQLAVDGGGDVVVTYPRTDTSTPGASINHVYAKRWLSTGSGFSSEFQISGPNTIDVNGTGVVIDSSGDATAVFPEDTLPPTGPVPSAPVIQAVRWPRASASPGAAQQLSTTQQGQARGAVAAVDPQGRVTVAWFATSNASVVYSAERTASGWNTTQRVSPDNGRSASTPKVAVDADGSATVVYSDNLPPTNSDADLKATRRFTGDTEWSPPVSVRATGPGAGPLLGSGTEIAAARAVQADVIFIQQLDGVNRLFAARFSSPDGYPRPRGATPFRVPLVPAFRQCVTSNSTHGAPLSYGSCRPPVQESSYLTIGTPDANGKPAASVGFLQLTTIAGNPSTPADEADVGITMSLSDVRNRGNLADYTGELKANLGLRITDRRNSPSGTDAATVSDLTFPVTVPCAATAEDVGGKCAVSTTADTVVPGAVPESARTIWQLGRVGVYDGGADGVASTVDGDSIFVTQGLFVP
jgi:hypothetical protein